MRAKLSVGIVVMNVACSPPPAVHHAPVPGQAAPIDARPRADVSGDAPPAPAFEAIAGMEGAFVVRVPPAREVAVGRGHACALAEDGSVWCWRDPPEDPALASPYPGVPGAFADLGPATAIAAADEATCTVVDGAVRCVGGLVDGAQVDDVVGLSVSDTHACAVRVGGRVACWGDGSFGQLGAPSAGEVPGVEDVVQVASGAYAACAVQRTGALYCWGAASLIAWAPGSAGYKPPQPTPPTRLLGMSDVVEVSLRNWWPCLRERSGHVRCWALEDQPTILPENPLPASTLVPDLQDAVQLSGEIVLRANGTLAVVAMVFDPADAERFRAAPFGSGVLHDIVDVDGTAQRGCAVLRDGAIRCWRAPEQ